MRERGGGEGGSERERLHLQYETLAVHLEVGTTGCRCLGGNAELHSLCKMADVPNGRILALEKRILAKSNDFLRTILKSTIMLSASLL